MNPSSQSRKSALRSAHFVLSVINSGNGITEPAPSPFLAIPKRLLKRAVDRNAVKRVCREALRVHQIGGTSRENGQQKLIKLVSLPSFESIQQLKNLVRVDIDRLLFQLR